MKSKNDASENSDEAGGSEGQNGKLNMEIING